MKEFLVYAVKTRDRCACMHLMKNADVERREREKKKNVKNERARRMKKKDDRRLKQETRHFR